MNSILNESIFDVHLWRLGEAIETRLLKKRDPVASSPLTFTNGSGGYWSVFSYGVVAFFNIPLNNQKSVLDQFIDVVKAPMAIPTLDNEQVVLDTSSNDQIKGGRICISDITVEKIQLINVILARSAILESHEKSISVALASFEPLSEELKKGRIRSKHSKQLLNYFAEGLIKNYTMVNKIEIIDKPDLLWDNPSLEKLYNLLENEYEIDSRFEALEQKIKLFSDSSESLFHIVTSQRSNRLELYIIFLIILEIVLSFLKL